MGIYKPIQDRVINNTKRLNLNLQGFLYGFDNSRSIYISFNA